jgi:SAM-dependent methyltransferase
VSRQRLDDHRRLWAGKPVLAAVYRPWFDALLDQAPRGERALEIGAGPGFFRERARETRPDLRWTATDIIGTPWNDVAADGTRLPFAGEAFGAVLCVDLIHHLARPGDFLAEAARVLRAGGRLAAIEPWVSPLSYPIYRWAHEEGCRLGIDPWAPFGSGPKEAFEGDGALAWRVVSAGDAPLWRTLGFAPPRVRRLNAFGYLLSLGFRPASLLPVGLAPLAGRLDALTQPFARLTAMRALIVWEKVATAGQEGGGAPGSITAGRIRPA